MSDKQRSLKSAMGPRSRTGTPVAATFAGGAPAKAGGGETLQTSVRMPADLHKRARYYSIDSGVSLNQLIVEGLALRIEQ